MATCSAGGTQPIRTATASTTCISYPGAGTPSGGIFDTGGEFPNHAIFMVAVQDVAAVCAQVERLGGKVLVPPTTSKDGLVFADLHDPAGNHFGVLPRRPRSRRRPPSGTGPSPGSWRSRTSWTWVRGPANQRSGDRMRARRVARAFESADPRLVTPYPCPPPPSAQAR